MKPHFQLFAAGACLNDGEPGGWAFRIVHPRSGANLGQSGAVFCGTTLPRMQMLAVVLGLERIKQRSKVEVFSAIGEELADRLSCWQKDRHRIENEGLWTRLEKLCGKTGHVVSIGEADLSGVTAVAERIAITLSWQRGLTILPCTAQFNSPLEWQQSLLGEEPAQKPPLEEFLRKFEELKRRREEKDKQLFVLQDADGDFVAAVKSDECSTICGPHFIFTKDPGKARIFRFGDLWGIGDLAARFAEGFSGSRSRRVTPTL